MEEKGKRKRLWHSTDERPEGGKDVAVLRDNRVNTLQRWDGSEATPGKFRAFGVVRWCYFDELVAVDGQCGR